MAYGVDDISGRNGAWAAERCPARKRFKLGSASIRSRQERIAGKVGYMACASGEKPKGWMRPAIAFQTA